jgi:HSP20 family protein
MIRLQGGRLTDARESRVEIDVIFDFDQPPIRGRHQRLVPWRPPIDVVETGGALAVRAEIGRLKTGQMQVLLSGNELLISGKRDVIGPVGPRVYHESRVRYGLFEAVVQLPFAVDVEAATAVYGDGFLTVDLPRLVVSNLMKRAGRGAV